MSLHTGRCWCSLSHCSRAAVRGREKKGGDPLRLLFLAVQGIFSCLRSAILTHDGRTGVAGNPLSPARPVKRSRTEAHGSSAQGVELKEEPSDRAFAVKQTQT